MHRRRYALGLFLALVVLGAALLAYMIPMEGEPGMLPLLLLVIGGGGLLLARKRQ